MTAAAPGARQEVTTQTRMIPSSWSLWLGGVGCLLAVVFSATWMSLSGLSGGFIRRLESKNADLAGRLEFWLSNRDRYRVAVRLLFVLDTLLLAFCFASWEGHCTQNGLPPFHRFAPPLIGVLAFLALTEWLGHDLSSLGAARLLAWSLPVVRFLSVLVLPVAVPVILWHRWLAERHRSSVDEEEATAEDEIISLVEQDAQQEENGGALEADERRMIRGVFDLDETLVREIMTPRVDLDAVRESGSIDDVRQRIVASGHSRIPVYRNTVDNILGVVYAKDLLNEGTIAGAGSLADLFHAAMFIPETKNIGDLLAEFQQTNNQFAVVLDEYGGTAGVVTVEDILEEIVGEIRDEYDVDEVEQVTHELPDGSVVVEARVPIAELSEILDTELPESEDYDTLGGFLSTVAGRIPQQGEVVKTDGLQVEILAADSRRVLKAKVRREAPEDVTEPE